MRNTKEEMAMWKATPKDYRGVVNNTRMVLVYNSETGATEMWPLTEAYKAKSAK